MLENVNISIIHPVLLLLRSLHIEVQYEGVQLIKLLIPHKSLQKELIHDIVQLLQPSKLELQQLHEVGPFWGVQ